MTSFTVNNQPVRYRLPPDTPLLWALRDASNLTGTKYGCGTGDCGACSITVDGRLICACLMLAVESEGKSLGTIAYRTKVAGVLLKRAVAIAAERASRS